MAGESLGYVAVEVRADTTAARAELAKFNSDIKRMGTAAAGGAGAMSAAAVSGRTGIGAWAAAASSKVLSLSSSLNRVSRSMGTTGRMLTWRLSLPLAAIGASAVKAANTFEMTFARIEGLAGKIGISMDEAKEKVKELAVAYGRDPQELAEGLYFIASAGVKAKDAMSVLEESAQGAAQQLGDTQTIAQMLTTVMNNYGSSGMNAAGALDILTQAVKLGKAEPKEFAESLGSVIPMASQLGVSFASMTAAVAQGTNAGLSAARAATGLRFILGSLQKVTPQAKKVLDDYGLTVEELQGKFKELGATGGIQYLARLFDTTTTKGKEAFAVLMGGQRGLIIANALIGENLQNASRIDRIMATAMGSGVADRALAETAKTQAQRFRELNAQWQVFKIELGEEIVPLLLEHVIPAIRGILDAFSDLSDAWKKRIVTGGIFAVLMGPATMFLGVLTKIAAGLVWIGGKGLGLLAGRGVMAAVTAASGGAIGPATVGALGWAMPSAAAAAGGAGTAAAVGTTASVSAILTPLVLTAIVAAVGFYFEKKRDDKRKGELTDPRLGGPTTDLLDPNLPRAPRNYNGVGGTTNPFLTDDQKFIDARLSFSNSLKFADFHLQRWAQMVSLQYTMSNEQADTMVGLIRSIEATTGAFDDNKREVLVGYLKQGDVVQALKYLADVLAIATAGVRNFSYAVLQSSGQAAPSGIGGRRINPGGLAEHGAITGLAAGGFLVTRPTFIRGNVLTGEKRKKEAVIPLEDVRGKRILAGAMAEAMGSASGSTVVVNVAGKVERPEDIRRELDWWMRSRGL